MADHVITSPVMMKRHAFAGVADAERRLVRVTYLITGRSERKPNEQEAILRLRYSDGSTELAELLAGEFVDF